MPQNMSQTIIPFDPDESTVTALAQAIAFTSNRDEPTPEDIASAQRRVNVWNDWREVIGLKPFP